MIWISLQASPQSSDENHRKTYLQTTLTTPAPLLPPEGLGIVPATSGASRVTVHKIERGEGKVCLVREIRFNRNIYSETPLLSPQALRILHDQLHTHMTARLHVLLVV
jgi:hypothetical protein